MVIIIIIIFAILVLYLVVNHRVTEMMNYLDNADEIKIKYACALTQLAGADETIKVPSVGDRPPRDLSRQALAEVVEPRYEELFTLIQSELRRSGFEDLVAAGIVLTGGTSKMEGAAELAEEIFIFTPEQLEELESDFNEELEELQREELEDE